MWHNKKESFTLTLCQPQMISWICESTFLCYIFLSVSGRQGFQSPSLWEPLCGSLSLTHIFACTHHGISSGTKAPPL